MSGRVWRDGQLEHVIIYRVLCPGSPDEVLCGIAIGKVMMHEWFVGNEQLQKKLFHREDTDSDDDYLQEDDTTEAPRGRRSKVSVRPSKTPATGSETQGEVDPTPSAPKSRARGGKSTVVPVSNPGSKSKKRKNPENTTKASEATTNDGVLEDPASAPKRTKLSSKTSNKPSIPQPSPQSHPRPPSQPNKPAEPEPPVIAEPSFEASGGPPYEAPATDLANTPAVEKPGSVTPATLVQPTVQVDKGKGKERATTLGTGEWRDHKLSYDARTVC